MQTVEISEEERALKGAPQGELYMATIYKRDEVTPCEDVDVTLTEWVAKVEGQELKEWFQHFEFIQNMRKVAIHHPQSMTAELATKICPAICESGASTRSVLAHNAVDCLWDLSIFCGPALVESGQVEAAMTVILDNSKKSKPKVIREAAAKALEEMPTFTGYNDLNGLAAKDSVNLLKATIPVACDAKHSNSPELLISFQAMAFVERAVKRLVEEQASSELQEIGAVLLQGLGTNLKSRSADAKSCTKNTINTVTTHISMFGQASLDELVDASKATGVLSDSEASEVLTASKKMSSSKAKGASSANDHRAKIRELKKAKMKAKQAQEASDDKKEEASEVKVQEDKSDEEPAVQESKSQSPEPEVQKGPSIPMTEMKDQVTTKEPGKSDNKEGGSKTTEESKVADTEEANHQQGKRFICC